MISVVGEALIDLVITPDGAVDAKLGGAPFNTARACARLGAPTQFVAAISRDRFGSQLAEQLHSDGVDVTQLVRVDVPTTLAAAELDHSGAATYRFYLDGTSAPALNDANGVGGASTTSDTVFTGGLGLVLEPMATTIEQTLARRPSGLVMVDVNCRPLVVVDRAAYVDRIDRVLRTTDVVKVSDEDLDFLRPGSDPLDAARGLLDRGVEAVLLTRGAAGTVIVTAGGEATVPIEAVDVIDTIGAGDSFDGGFLAWWHANGLGRAEISDVELLGQAVRAANRVAGVVVGRRGADPPWRRELDAGWSDRSG